MSVGANARHAHRLRSGDGRGRGGEVGHLADRHPVGVRGPDAEHVDGCLLRVRGALSGGDDQRTCAVGDETAIQLVEGFGDELRADDVLDRERFTRVGVRVLSRPFSKGDRDLGELLARRAVLVHVTTRRQAVAADGKPHPVGQVPLKGRGLVGATGSAAGERVRALARGCRVDDDGDLAEPGGDRRGGVLDVYLEARSTGHGRIGEATAHAEPFGQIQGRHHPVVREHGIDLADGDAGVVERVAHHVQLELVDGTIEGARRRGGVDRTDNRRRSAQRMGHRVSSACSSNSDRSEAVELADVARGGCAPCRRPRDGRCAPRASLGSRATSNPSAGSHWPTSAARRS